MRDRETERKTERDRERETEEERQRETDRERQRKIERENLNLIFFNERKKEREGERKRDSESERKTERKTERDREVDRDRERQRDREIEREPCCQTLSSCARQGSVFRVNRSPSLFSQSLNLEAFFLCRRRRIEEYGWNCHLRLYASTLKHLSYSVFFSTYPAIILSNTFLRYRFVSLCICDCLQLVLLINVVSGQTMLISVL